MSKKKQKLHSGIKWPTPSAVKLRDLERRSKGAIAKNTEMGNQLKRMVRMDAMSRLPMPSHTDLAREIAAAHAAPKLVKGSPAALADKENYEKTNKAWDQVNKIREHNATMMAVPRMIAPFARMELLLSIPPLERKTFVRICKLLADDTIEYVRIMNDIHSRHIGKTGNAIGFDEQELSRYVFSEYVEMSELWMTTTLPVIEHMVALLQSGLSALAVENEELAKQITAGIGKTIDDMGAAIMGTTTAAVAKDE